MIFYPIESKAMLFRRNSIVRSESKQQDNFLEILLLVALAGFVGLVVLQRPGEASKAWAGKKTGEQYIEPESLEAKEPGRKSVRFHPMVHVQEIPVMRKEDYPEYFGEC